jgi:hypothetical protein
MSFAAVSEMIGIERGKAAGLYRDQAIANQAAALGIETGNLERSFSLLTLAMNTAKLRGFIAAPIASQVTPGTDPIQLDHEDELRELLKWIFGDGIVQPVITDSREMTKLGNVVATEIGLKSLRDGESLDHALQRVKDEQSDPHKRLVNRLRAGRNSLISAAEDIADFAHDQEVQDLVDEVREALVTLEAPIDAEEADRASAG